MSAESRIPSTNSCRYHQEGSLAAIAIDHPAFSASILFQGAQLVRFAPRGQSSWLWLSETEPFHEEEAVRGGIPVCWPWFGDPSRNPAPVRQHIHTDQAHGLVRTADWQLESIEESAHQVSLALALDTHQLDATLWSGQARVVIRFHCAADRLKMELETTNTGATPLHLSQALHSYFPTADIRQTQVHGLSGQRYVDALEGWQTKIQEAPVEFNGEIDRIYCVPGKMQLATPQGVMQLEQQSARTAIVWNPWQEKALRLSHFAPTAWERMYCVETANALEDYVTLDPDGTHTMGFCLSQL